MFDWTLGNPPHTDAQQLIQDNLDGWFRYLSPVVPTQQRQDVLVTLKQLNRQLSKPC